MQTDPKKICKHLEPFVLERRKQRIESVIEQRLNSIQLAIECPSDIHNALAAVRSAEALGIHTVHLIQPEGDATGIRAVTQGAVDWVDILHHNSFSAFLKAIKNEGRLLAGGVVDTDTALHDVPINKPLCIIIGNESRGLSDAAKAACDILYTIPLFGMSESFNLSVSAAISLYDTTQRKRSELKANGDLNESQKTALRARGYLNSVNQRLIDQLLK